MNKYVTAATLNRSRSDGKPEPDLDAHAETLRLILEDMARARELDHVAKFITEAISQIEIAQVRRDFPQLRVARNWRFEPRKY